MRLAVLSDVHGNLPALEAVIADLRAEGCEAIVNLGDILSGPLWPAKTADLLMREDTTTAPPPKARREGREDWAEALLAGRVDRARG